MSVRHHPDTLLGEPVALEPNTYLTDGHGLWRFECFLPKAGGVILEDSVEDRIFTTTLREFADMRLSRIDLWMKEHRGDR